MFGRRHFYTYSSPCSQGNDLDDVRISTLPRGFKGISRYDSIDNKDYIILYALPGQSGETIFNFNSTPEVDLANAANVSLTVLGSSVTLNYKLQGINQVTVTTGDKTVEVIIMDKSTALQWNAVDIFGKGDFGGHFAFGTNER